MAYIGSSPTKVVSRQSANIFTYTATANQTAFTGSDANGNTLACTPSDIMVHMNGIKLEESDYTASTTTVTLGSGAAAGDEITITAFVTFESADHYNKSTADTRYVNTTGDTMTGTLVAGTRLQVGDSSITQQYPALGYVADFQASSGSQTFISIAEPSASSLGNNGVIIGEDASDTYITQRGNKNIKLATQDLNRLIVDGSGRVTMPYQPIISGTMGTAMTHPSGDQLLSFDSFFVSRGITFNSSTKRFTVPTAGVYSIMMTPFTYGGNSPYRVFIGVNTDAPIYASHRGHFYDNDTTTYASGALHSVVELAANDYIVFRLHQGKLYNQSSDRFNEFSICKIA